MKFKKGSDGRMPGLGTELFILISFSVPCHCGQAALLNTTAGPRWQLF